MCGRFSFAYDDWSGFLEMFGVQPTEFTFPERYNIAPTQEVAAIVSDGARRRIGRLRWGLIPSWSPTDKTSFQAFNARVETVLVRPAFKSLIQRRRCIVPATGFIEWHRHTKQPLYIRVRSRDVFGFAGLWDTWKSKEGLRVSTCTILTCRPNPLMNSIHDRMPVILSRDGEDAWLNRQTTDPAHLMHLLKPYSETDMYYYPISDRIGNVKYDSPMLLLPEAST